MFKLFLKNKETKKRRSFTTTQKIFIFYKQNGLCNNCKEKLDLRTVRYDHIIRYTQGGETEIDNCQALCSNCHSMKTFEENIELINNK